MTTEQFYRRITVLPFAVTLAAAVVAWALSRVGDATMLPSAIVGIASGATLIAFCGAVAAVPYLIFLAPQVCCHAASRRRHHIQPRLLVVQ